MITYPTEEAAVARMEALQQDRDLARRHRCCHPAGGACRRTCPAPSTGSPPAGPAIRGYPPRPGLAGTAGRWGSGDASRGGARTRRHSPRPAAAGRRIRKGRHHRKDRGCRKSTAAVMLLVLAVVAGLIMATGIYVATVIY